MPRERDAHERHDEPDDECDGGDRRDPNAEQAQRVDVVGEDVEVEDREHDQREDDGDQRERDREHVVERREDEDGGDARAVAAREEVRLVGHRPVSGRA
jgi:hypothetical protein